jgi:ABC-type branched-subunit amino acid transport system substrate-binding protein
MRPGSRPRALRLLALFAVLALLAAACGNSGDDSDGAADEPGTTEAPTDDTDAPDDTGAPGTTTGDADDYSEFVSFEEEGVTDTEIRVGSIGSITNPIGTDHAAFNEGIELYFEKVNSEGGIWGRELRLVSTRDDQLGLNLQEAEALVSQDNVYAAFIDVLLFTGWRVLADEGIPTFGWNINPEWAGPENFFPNTGALCFGCIGRIVPWLAQQAGATTVGILAYGNSDQSKQCGQGNRLSFEEFGDDVGGIEVGFYDDALQFGQTDMSAQVSAMRSAGVDFITTCMDLNGVFTLANEMALQGLDATFHHPNMYNREFVAQNAALFDGDYVIPGFTAIEHEPRIPAVQEFVDAAGDDWVELTVQGWIAAKQFVDALKATGPEFTREALIETWNNQPEPYTADGWLAPIDWRIQHADPKANPDKAAPLTCANIVQIRDGGFVSVFTEGEKQWVCFDQTVDEFGEPVLMSFAG